MQTRSSIDHIPPGKKVYFASDFHLGAGPKSMHKPTEERIVRWLDEIKENAYAIYLLGDMFDFWFEYKRAIPKGFIRFQGKLAEISDAGIPITFFTGNHDMWLFDYFPTELNIPVIRQPMTLSIGNSLFHIGHGDGLGPGDFTYKLIKKVFNNKICQWAFERIHPNLGVGIANFWSRKSRISSNKKEDKFLGENEWLLQYCRKQEQTKHHDYYIFGHRHLPLDLEVNAESRYINLGEWINYFTYAEYDGNHLELKAFEKDK